MRLSRVKSRVRPQATVRCRTPDSGTIRAGEVANGILLDDAVGYEFALIGDPSVIAALRADTRDFLDRIGVVVIADDSVGVHSALASIDAKVMLVRPDRYLVGVASSAAEVGALVEQLADSLGSTVAA